MKFLMIIFTLIFAANVAALDVTITAQHTEAETLLSMIEAADEAGIICQLSIRDDYEKGIITLSFEIRIDDDQSEEELKSYLLLRAAFDILVYSGPDEFEQNSIETTLCEEEGKEEEVDCARSSFLEKIGLLKKIPLGEPVESPSGYDMTKYTYVYHKDVKREWFIDSLFD